MSEAPRIDLAHEAEFRLGRITVRPQLRQLVRGDGAEEIVEPRVMQVLVALARAEGGIVTRDELGSSCWESRIVGEDAINRVLSRLRRVSEGIGAGSFRIETITKVGYRLLREGQSSEAGAAAPARPGLSRRAVVGGSVAAAVAAGTAVTLGLLRPGSSGQSQPPEAAALMAQAEAAYREFSPQGTNRAIGLLRRVVEIAPRHADGWGLLTLAYAQAYWSNGNRRDSGMLTRARDAHERCRALDPDGPYVALGEVVMMPWGGTWARSQQLARAALARYPDNDLLNQTLGRSLLLVGRIGEGLPLVARSVELSPTVPGFRFSLAMALWSAGRLDEADRAIDEGLRLFPSHYALWFARFYVDLYSGQVGKAIAHAEDKGGRPVGYAEAEFDRMLLAARALESRRPADIDAALAAALEAARGAVGHCAIAIQYASAMGRPDTAFMVADALFFGRGFDPGEVAYSASEAKFIRRNDRLTEFLFFPSTAAIRGDPRFDRLVGEIGLAKYWRETGTLPDYRRG